MLWKAFRIILLVAYAPIALLNYKFYEKLTNIPVIGYLYWPIGVTLGKITEILMSNLD